MSKKDTGKEDRREQQLAEVAKQVEGLRQSPLYEYRVQHGYRPVVGEGDPHARIMFIGEAPGEQEAKTGRPFVGAAGALLDSLLESAGISRADVYITSVLKDRPPGNRDPRAAELDVYSPFLWRQVEIIQPKVIITLGRFAMALVLEHFRLPEKDQKIGELHGKRLTAKAPWGEIAILPMYHPAAAFYARDLRQGLAEDFQALKGLV